jgi:hypothetical protein
LADDDVRECLRLADSVDEAVREAGRLRAFLVADLARYRDALPGAATSYLERLQDALAAGYDPRPDDLAALRALRGNPAAAAVLRRCQGLAEQSVRDRLAGRTVHVPAPAQAPRRARLLALPGGRAGQGVAVAGEVGDEERTQPACLADRLVDGVGQAQTFPDIVVGQGDGVKGDGEGASEHTQLVRTERHAATGSVWRGHALDDTC